MHIAADVRVVPGGDILTGDRDETKLHMGGGLENREIKIISQQLGCGGEEGGGG